MTLTIRSRQVSRVGFDIELDGRLDSVAAEDLEEALRPILAARPQTLRMDMAGLSYISSMGIGIVVRALKVVRESGGRMALVHLQPGVQKVFEIVSALPDMGVFSSRAEADRYFDAIQRRVTGDPAKE